MLIRIIKSIYCFLNFQTVGGKTKCLKFNHVSHQFPFWNWKSLPSRYNKNHAEENGKFCLLIFKREWFLSTALICLLKVNHRVGPAGVQNIDFWFMVSVTSPVNGYLPLCPQLARWQLNIQCEGRSGLPAQGSCLLLFHAFVDFSLSAWYLPLA